MRCQETVRLRRGMTTSRRLALRYIHWAMLAPRERSCCLVIEVEAFEGDYCWVAEVPHPVRTPWCLSRKYDGIRNLSSRTSCTFRAAPSPCSCRISCSASPSWQTFDRKLETASGLIRSHITSIVGCDLRLTVCDPIALKMQIFEKAHSSH